MVFSLKDTTYCTELSIIVYLINRIGRKEWFFFLQINRIGDSELSQGLNKSAENAVL
jgi:hypothetical protein